MAEFARGARAVLPTCRALVGLASSGIDLGTRSGLTLGEAAEIAQAHLSLHAARGQLLEAVAKAVPTSADTARLDAFDAYCRRPDISPYVLVAPGARRLALLDVSRGGLRPVAQGSDVRTLLDDYMARIHAEVMRG